LQNNEFIAAHAGDGVGLSDTVSQPTGHSFQQRVVEVVCQPFHSGLRGNEVYAIRDLTERHRNEAKIRRALAAGARPAICDWAVR
jgi:hypothetical protein